MACAQSSLEPVAVAYRTQPVTSLPGVGGGSDQVISGGSPVGVISTTTGAFGGSLDVSGALAEQACQEAAQSGASRQRASKVEASAASLVREATSAWSRLEGEASSCLELKDVSSRAPCIEAVSSYIASAEGLSVTVTEGFEEVETDCGVRSVPLAGSTRSVSVPTLSSARSLLSNLEQAPAPSSASTLPAARSQLSNLEQMLTPSSASASPGRAGIEWVRIPGGTFEMGSRYGQYNEQPAHTVRVANFELMQTEVTVGQYRSTASAWRRGRVRRRTTGPASSATGVKGVARTTR